MVNEKKYDFGSKERRKYQKNEEEVFLII